MKKVVIVLGTYGYQRNPEGPVDAISEKNGPIEVSDSEAERLVKLGVAKYATEESTYKVENPSNEDPLKDIKINDLRAKAKELGLSAAGTKEELYERIMEASKTGTEGDEIPPQNPEGDENPQEPDGDDNPTDEKPPVLEPANPEV